MVQISADLIFELKQSLKVYMKNHSLNFLALSLWQFGSLGKK